MAGGGYQPIDAPRRVLTELSPAGLAMRNHSETLTVNVLEEEFGVVVSLIFYQIYYYYYGHTRYPNWRTRICDVMFIGEAGT